MSRNELGAPRRERTLFELPAPEGGAPGGRRRAARSAGPSSDVSRTRGLAAGAGASALVGCLSAALLAPPGGLSSVGPLARPHARAGLTCASCHGEAAGPLGAPRAEPEPSAPSRVTDAVCVGCHGPHPSARQGHAALAERPRCASCHAIHGDQGVAFAPGEPPARFGPGAEIALPPAAFLAERPITVPVVTLRSCAGCHDASSPADPIARCLFPDQAALGAERPVLCFDEHRKALDDARGPRPGGAACDAQHAPDRSAAWEAARDAVRLAPEAPSVSSPIPFLAVALGLGAGALTTLGARLAGRARALRRHPAPGGAAKRVAAPPEPGRKRLPVVDAATCLGCNACVDACPYAVLEIERFVAVVARPDACCGLSLCEQRCPNGSLRMVPGGESPAGPALTPDLESEEVPGLYLAGDVTGAPLIKNAIAQGARAAEAAAASIRRSGGSAKGELDLLVVGAGPAGLSAALRARELGLGAAVVEQGALAASIRSFPRGKLVFDQPLDLPSVGSLWLEESTKEELLAQWTLAARKARLDVREHTRVSNVRRAPQNREARFEVECVPAEGPAFTLAARRVVLAIGQRGTPRRLPFALPPEVETKVHHHLSDAQAFSGKRLLVVGLGDVAMETAIALARQPDTRVTVVHRGDAFRRGSARNIEALKRLVRAGQVDLRFRTEVAALTASHAELATPGGTERLAYDAAFVMIGSIPSLDVLRRAGVSMPSEHDF